MKREGTLVLAYSQRCIPWSPPDTFHYGAGSYPDPVFSDLFTKNIEQILISAARTKAAIPMDALFRLHTLHQPMHADQRRIRRIKSRHVTQRPLLCFPLPAIPGTGKLALQEIKERLIGGGTVHFLENTIDIREEIASCELSPGRAPALAFDLGDFDFCFFQRLPDFRRLTVDEFCPQFDRHVQGRILDRENAPTNAIPRFQNAHAQTCACQLAGGRQACYTRTNDDYGWILHSRRQRPL